MLESQYDNDDVIITIVIMNDFVLHLICFKIYDLVYRMFYEYKKGKYLMLSFRNVEMVLCNNRNGFIVTLLRNRGYLPTDKFLSKIFNLIQIHRLRESICNLLFCTDW